MPELNYGAWLADIVDFLTAHAGGVVYSTTVVQRYKEVNRTTLLNWIKQAEESRYVQRVELVVSRPSRVAYSLHPEWIERAGRINDAIKGII